MRWSATFLKVIKSPSMTNSNKLLLDRTEDSVNSCDLVFICVPTPTRTDGRTCDVSAVEESVRWVVRPMCIRSTIPAGTVDRLMYETGKEISFYQSTSENNADILGGKRGRAAL